MARTGYCCMCGELAWLSYLEAWCEPCYDKWTPVASGVSAGTLPWPAPAYPAVTHLIAPGELG